MPRTKGSKNKPKGTNMVTLQFDKQIKGAPVTKVNPMGGWVNYGADNCYPFQLLNLYNSSVTHRACIDFATNAVVGEGIDWNAMQLKSEDIQAPNYSMGWNEFIRALAFEFQLYGAFAFQVIKNKDNQTYSFFPQPVETIRLEEMDEDGVINGAWLCKDWSAWQKYPPVHIPMFGFQDGETIPRGEAYLFYHRQYTPVNAYYGLPCYTAALNAIQAESQFQLFDLKNITNGFTATGALTLPAVETDEERAAVIRSVQNMFTGAENANSLLISFRTNIEDNPVVYTPFVANSDTVNIYADSNERTIARIMAAHKIPSKALIGYSLDDTGFSNSGEFLESAFALYNVNVANSARNEIVGVINHAFRANGVETEIVLKPLRYKFDDNTTVNSTVSNEGDETTDDTATERKDNTI